MAKSFTIESRMVPPPCEMPKLDYPVTQKEKRQGDQKQNSQKL